MFTKWVNFFSTAIYRNTYFDDYAEELNKLDPFIEFLKAAGFLYNPAEKESEDVHEEHEEVNYDEEKDQEDLEDF